MKKRIKQSVAVSLVFLFLLLTFTGCKKNEISAPVEDDYFIDSEQKADNEENDFDFGQNDVVTVQPQKTTITEISSTGQMPYSNYAYLGKSGEHDLYTSDTNMFPFKYSSKYGFADAEGNVIITEKYDEVYLFSEGKAIVQLNNEWIIIDAEGNELYKIPEKYGNTLANDNGTGFKNGKAIIPTTSETSSGKTLNLFVINSNFSTSQVQIPVRTKMNFKIVNTPEFAGVIVFEAHYENNAAGESQSINTYRLVDLSGNEIWKIDMPYDILSSKLEKFEYKKALVPNYTFSLLSSINVENGYINVFDENFKWGLVNVSTGELVLDYNYDYVGTYSDGLCNVCIYSKWGYVDLNGKQPITFDYRYTEKFVNGNAIVIMNDYSFCIIDKKGEVAYDSGIDFVPPQHTQCKYQIHTDLQDKGIIVIWDYYGDKYYVINVSGSAMRIDEGYYPVVASEDHILIDKRMFAIG